MGSVISTAENSDATGYPLESKQIVEYKSDNVSDRMKLDDVSIKDEMITVSKADEELMLLGKGNGSSETEDISDGKIEKCPSKDKTDDSNGIVNGDQANIKYFFSRSSGSTNSQVVNQKQNESSHDKVQFKSDKLGKASGHMKLDKRSDDSPVLTDLKEIANGVRKILTPFYRKKDIPSKDIFKEVARHLTHSCIRSISLEKNLESVQLVVDAFFKQNKVCATFELFSEFHGATTAASSSKNTEIDK